MKLQRILPCLFLLLPICGKSQAPVMTIPHPVKAQLSGESTAMPSGDITLSGDSLRSEAQYLNVRLYGTGKAKRVKVSKRGKAKRGILLRIDKTLPGGPEAYQLQVTPQVVTITGTSRAGIFYGIQTLMQDYADDSRLQTGTITDAPRYPWRGIMIDEARHFFGKEKIKQILEIMGQYKLNRFHWHLTDEQGWRIEIKQYPRLTEVGGRGSWSEPDGKEARYYTQEEIRDIVKYAADRHIEIIPEIDMPGHATAANRAYIGLSGGGTKDHPHFTFNPGRDSVYTFLTNVLYEVADLFPSPYIHLGGDEVAFGIQAWKTDPDVQALMRREGMTDVKQAEAYFMRRMADTVRAMGKTLTGWDELLDLNTDPKETLIMWWRHDRDASLKRSLDSGYTTILCPRRPMYFDFIQHKNHKWGRVWSGFCPIEDVYAFPDRDFELRKVSPEQQRHIRGIQANVWTERIHTPERLDFMLFPRIFGVAEAGWTQPENKDYADFSRRMEPVYRALDAAGIYYFDPRNPDRHPEPKGAERKDVEVPFDFRD